MTIEEQLYREADKYLQALNEHKSQDEAERVFSSLDMKQSAIGLLQKENAIMFMSDGYTITSYGKTTLIKGGFYKLYLHQKRMNQVTYFGVICSVIAAITGIISIVISLIK